MKLNDNIKKIIAFILIFSVVLISSNVNVIKAEGTEVVTKPYEVTWTDEGPQGSLLADADIMLEKVTSSNPKGTAMEFATFVKNIREFLHYITGI